MAEQGRAGRLVGGRYRLVAELGAGGFGRVWRAVDEMLRVEVAVKEVWLPPASSPEDQAARLARAQREGRNAAALRDHPGIVAVHDVVVDGDAPWIVMRLVDGASLQRQLDRYGPMPPERAAELARVLLTALGAAHAAGITHRDVKPANVLLTADGRPLLTDFGIAVQAADTRLTTTGSLIGSLEYMAPERFEGVDTPAGDFYSLGVLLYEAVEGTSPFRRETPTGTLAAVMLGEAPPPVRAGSLGPLITALMARRPEQRPSVATALALLGPAPAPAPPEHPPTVLDVPQFEPAPAAGPRAGKVAGGVALALALAAVATVLAVHFAGNKDGTDGQRAASPPPSSAPATSPAPVESSSPSTPAVRPSASASFDATLLNDSSTDPAPLSTAAMLPATFTTKKDGKFHRVASGVQPCAAPRMSDDVKGLLSTDGCTSALTADYLGPGADGSEAVMVSVQIFPLDNATKAQRFYDGMWAPGEPDDNGEFGFWCPTTGTGKNVCSDGGWGRQGYHQHLAVRKRYVLEATALYFDNSTKRDDWTQAAATAATLAVGPDYYLTTR
ncbi:serine/threonine-protein kinase [Kitasatospora sp. NPDC002227]|uniref:serine/threonine-protein kinase n=1 Tax=Kitasatospora sp. NPDC002227 TaxID=3154773 RepID=UPI00331AD5F2